MAQKLYTRTWKNTGMEGTPIYVFQLADPNGTLGDAVGDIIMLSEDTSRKYIIHSYGVKVPVDDYVLYLEDNNYMDEYGMDAKGLGMMFVNHCEEVYTKGYTDMCYFEFMAEFMSSAMGFIVEEYTDIDTAEVMFRVYRQDFAEKMHIGEDCSFCFS